MATIEAQIEGALFKRVAELVTTPALALQWPNQHYEPVDGTPYLIVQHAPNDTERALIASTGAHRHLGLLMLTIAAPLDGIAIATTELAGQIAAHFPCDLRIALGSISVRIAKRPSVKSGAQEENRWRVPIVVDYECWA